MRPDPETKDLIELALVVLVLAGIIFLIVRLS